MTTIRTKIFTTKINIEQKVEGDKTIQNKRDRWKDKNILRHATNDGLLRYVRSYKLLNTNHKDDCLLKC